MKIFQRASNVAHRHSCGMPITCALYVHHGPQTLNSLSFDAIDEVLDVLQTTQVMNIKWDNTLGNSKSNINKIFSAYSSGIYILQVFIAKNAGNNSCVHVLTWIKIVDKNLFYR